MPDLSAALPTTELEEAFLRVVDTEGKLTAALEDLGPVAGRDVVLLDAGRGFRERQLAEIGARVTAVSFPDPYDEPAALARLAELPVGQADAVVVPWSELATPGSAFVAEAERLLRPCGRLLLIHDYGRDDVWSLLPDRRARQVEWSQRRGPFLGAGFRIRVIHCWWTFESAEQARELLVAGFGELGAVAADAMKRPRLEYQVAIYHRSAPDLAQECEQPVESEVARGAG
jgi:hypothetical protein